MKKMQIIIFTHTLIKENSVVMHQNIALIDFYAP